MDKRTRTHVSFVTPALIFAWLLLLGAVASAQTAAVLPVENRGVADADYSDIVEESAFLVTDHGVLTPVRHYELADWVGDSLAEQSLQCGADAACLRPLYAAGIDFVVGVSARMTATGVQVRYELLRLEDAARVADQAADLAGPRDFTALGPALSAALDRRDGPAVGAAAPAPAPPTSPVAAPVYTPPPVYAPPVAPRRTADTGRGPLAPVAIATGATGGALLLGGVFLGFAADDTQQEIQSMPHPADEVERLQKQGRSRQSAANALLISGGVLAATGVVLAIVDRPRERGLALDVGLSPRAVSARVRF